MGCPSIHLGRHGKSSSTACLHSAASSTTKLKDRSHGPLVRQTIAWMPLPPILSTPKSSMHACLLQAAKPMCKSVWHHKPTSCSGRTPAAWCNSVLAQAPLVATCSMWLGTSPTAMGRGWFLRPSPGPPMDSIGKPKWTLGFTKPHSPFKMRDVACRWTPPISASKCLHPPIGMRQVSAMEAKWPFVWGTPWIWALGNWSPFAGLNFRQHGLCPT